MDKKSILILPGDGIGPEVMAVVRHVLEFLRDKSNLPITITEDVVGGAAYDKYGVPLADETLARAQAADAVLLGAVGGPKWANVPYDKRPEAGLLKLRKELGLFANLRPAIVFDALIDASTLKPEVVRGLDIMIVRELTGGVYFGEPRGITDIGNGERRGVNTQVYTTSEIRRVARVAFDLARKRGKKLCSCEKANVMESGLLWREEVTRLHAESYSDVALSHMYADNCAMQLLKNPAQFDVILTDNLFGDILSDEAAMLTGSLGMLPSASLGWEDDAAQSRLRSSSAERVSTAQSSRAQKIKAMYEPIHGSAPDIAGRDVANPLASILSASMMLRYSFGWNEAADQLDIAVRQVLSNGIRTADITAKGQPSVGTKAMGDAVMKAFSA